MLTISSPFIIDNSQGGAQRPPLNLGLPSTMKSAPVRLGVSYSVTLHEIGHVLMYYILSGGGILPGRGWLIKVGDCAEYAGEAYVFSSADFDILVYCGGEVAEETSFNIFKSMYEAGKAWDSTKVLDRSNRGFFFWRNNYAEQFYEIAEYLFNKYVDRDMLKYFAGKLSEQRGHEDSLAYRLRPGELNDLLKSGYKGGCAKKEATKLCEHIASNYSNYGTAIPPKQEPIIETPTTLPEPVKGPQRPGPSGSSGTGSSSPPPTTEASSFDVVCSFSAAPEGFGAFGSVPVYLGSDGLVRYEKNGRFVRPGKIEIPTGYRGKYNKRLQSKKYNEQK